ncbi:MAG: serine protease [Myxococcota bacterium]
MKRMKHIGWITLAAIVAIGGCGSEADLELESSLASSESIVNGNRAQVDKVRLQGTLWTRSGQDFRYSCGATYLGAGTNNRHWALTAAHCVDSTVPSNLRLGFGRRNLTNYRDSDLAGVDRIVIHPGYNSENFRNDIAVLRLTRRPPGATAVVLASNPAAPALDAPVFITGFGYTKVTTPECRATGQDCGAPINLKQALTTVVPASECERFSAGINGVRQICTRDTIGKIQGACFGDSGGPMFRQDNMRQVGLTSFGSITCDPSFPQIYTRVTYHRGWIQNQTGI